MVLFQGSTDETCAQMEDKHICTDVTSPSEKAGNLKLSSTGTDPVYAM